MNWLWLLFMCLVSVGVSSLLIALVLTNRQRGDGATSSSTEVVRREAVGAIRQVRTDTARTLVAVEREAHVRSVDVKAKEHELLELQIRALKREEADARRRKRQEDWAIIQARKEAIDRRLCR